MGANIETPMSPGGLQASAGEGVSPCNIGIGNTSDTLAIHLDRPCTTLLG